MFDEIEASLGRTMTPEDMEIMTWAIYQSGQTIPAKLYSKTLQDWDRFSAQMAAFHREYDLLLTPTVADVAPPHGQFELDPGLLANLANMAAFSMQDQQELIWQMFADSLAWTPFTIFANLPVSQLSLCQLIERRRGCPSVFNCPLPRDGRTCSWLFPDSWKARIS